MRVLRDFVRLGLYVNAPAAIFFGTVDCRPFLASVHSINMSGLFTGQFPINVPHCKAQNRTVYKLLTFEPINTVSRSNKSTKTSLLFPLCRDAKRMTTGIHIIHIQLCDTDRFRGNSHNKTHGYCRICNCFPVSYRLYSPQDA